MENNMFVFSGLLFIIILTILKFSVYKIKNLKFSKSLTELSKELTKIKCSGVYYYVSSMSVDPTIYAVKLTPLPLGDANKGTYYIIFKNNRTLITLNDEIIFSMDMFTYNEATKYKVITEIDTIINSINYISKYKG